MAEDHPMDSPSTSPSSAMGSTRVPFWGPGVSRGFQFWGGGLPVLIIMWSLVSGGLWDIQLLLIWIGGTVYLGLRELINQGESKQTT